MRLVIVGAGAMASFIAKELTRRDSQSEIVIVDADGDQSRETRRRGVATRVRACV